MRLDTTQSIAAGVTFLNPQDQLRIDTPGFYFISAQMAWPNSATGARLLAIERNTAGNELVADFRLSAGGTELAQSVSTAAYLNAGDLIHMRAAQSTGTNFPARWGARAPAS